MVERRAAAQRWWLFQQLLIKLLYSNISGTAADKVLSRKLMGWVQVIFTTKWLTANFFESTMFAGIVPEVEIAPRSSGFNSYDLSLPSMVYSMLGSNRSCLTTSPIRSRSRRGRLQSGSETLIRLRRRIHATNVEGKCGGDGMPTFSLFPKNTKSLWEVRMVTWPYCTVPAYIRVIRRWLDGP